MDNIELFKSWIRAKRAEEKAKRERIEIEEKIFPLYENDIKASGTIQENGFKIIIKKNINYKLDEDKYAVIRVDIPDDLRPEKIKFSIDKKGYNYIQENHPDIYRMVSDCVTITEGKPTITISKI